MRLRALPRAAGASGCVWGATSTQSCEEIRRVGPVARPRARNRVQERRSQAVMGFLERHDLVAANTWGGERFGVESCTWRPAGSDVLRARDARRKLETRRAKWVATTNRSTSSW